MRVNISLPNELANKAKLYCDRNGYKLSTLLQHLLQLKMDAQAGLSKANSRSEVQELNFPTPAPDLEEEVPYFSESKMGNCTSCKRYRELEPVTFLDDDQIRVEGMFCQICKGRARVAGVLKI